MQGMCRLDSESVRVYRFEHRPPSQHILRVDGEQLTASAAG